MIGGLNVTVGGTGWGGGWYHASMDASAAGAPAVPPPDSASPASGEARERLWTPWRMRYVGGGKAEGGCLFCNRLAGDNDVEGLVLHRGERAFSIMNLFPYNTGHLMLVPNQHAASPEEADPAALAELAGLLPPALRALRRVLGCDGFNVGLNVGAVAGAGVADHLHQHVVPRWQGDANFMPILAATMVLPELIPISYAKIRAELARELTGASTVRCVVLGDRPGSILVEAGNDELGLPVASAQAGEPLWRAARRTANALVGAATEVIGWAGSARAGGDGIALTLRVAGSGRAGGTMSGSGRWLPAAEVATIGSDGRFVAAALANLATAEDRS